MVFKLIRVDIEQPSKIQLQVGKHLIGRGKFLHNDDADKRVSRNHAELEVTDDSVILKALHQNPCFYIKRSTVDTEILQQNNAIDLSNGDKFGLIPDNFWYEVIHCSEPDIHENETPCINQVENGREQSKKENESREQNGATPDTVNNEDEAVSFHMSEELDNPNSRSASPSLLNQEESTQGYALNTQACVAVPSTPNKRPNDSPNSSSVDLKRVKTESPTPDAQDAQPGPSNDQAVADPDSKDQKPNIVAPAYSPQPPAPQRERCMYGANCYRRNPQHKAQFSHPADGDWGEGARGVCPYGAACRKPDARHWAAHDHPPGAQPPRPAHAAHAARRPGMQVVERHGNMFYINAHSVNFYDDHFQVEDSDGDSVDYDYEF